MVDGRFERAAQHLWTACQQRSAYANLPAELAPRGVDEAYAIQDAYHRLATAARGPVAGWKIATTTRVMQELMGIDRPCGGAIFERTIHHTPARLRCADFVSLKIECEIAFRLAADLSRERMPYTPDSVLASIESVMPAFELIDDRHAVYKETRALSLIADNCWNAGVVLGGPARPPSQPELDTARGTLEISGRPVLHGNADGPLRALAWMANLVAGRGQLIRRGMVVITGSLIPTTAIAPGETAIFTVAGFGQARLDVL